MVPLTCPDAVWAGVRPAVATNMNIAKTSIPSTLTYFRRDIISPRLLAGRPKFCLELYVESKSLSNIFLISNANYSDIVNWAGWFHRRLD
jgi:hypothetical protein